MNDEPWIPNTPRPVRPAPSFVDRHLGLAVTMVVLGIGLLIVKPWGLGDGGTAAVPTTPAPTPTAHVTEAPVHVGFEDFAYDPSIFGNREPTPHWDLWPAAYLVTYGFVIQLGGPSASVAPVPIGSVPPVQLRPPGASPTAPTDGGPAWPASVTVPAGYHVFVVGIDMPQGASLASAHLARETPAGGEVEVGLAFPPSPWPDHFAVLGIPAAVDPSRLQTWTPATYRLDLDFALSSSTANGGPISRSIEIVIEAPPTFGEQPTPVPSR